MKSILRCLFIYLHYLRVFFSGVLSLFLCEESGSLDFCSENEMKDNEGYKRFLLSPASSLSLWLASGSITLPDVEVKG